MTASTPTPSWRCSAATSRFGSPSRWSRLDDAFRALEETQADVLVIAPEGHSDRALLLLERAVKADPDRPVLVLSADLTCGFLRRVFEMGGDDILTLPQSPEQFRFAVEKALARRQGSAAGHGAELGRLIAVLGPKGGTGKTLTSANLSVALAQVGKSAVIVDLDLQFGDVGLCMGLPPDVTMYDLALAGGTIDVDKLDAYVITHPSGAHALLAPNRPDQAGAVTVQLLQDVYAALRSKYDFVVVDTPPGFTPEVIATIDASTDLVMVGMLDSLSLKNTKLGLETLELMGYERDDDPARPQPRAQSRRHQPERRDRRSRPRAGRLRPERPRDPTGRQRGRADRARAPRFRVVRRISCSCRPPRRHVLVNRRDASRRKAELRSSRVAQERGPRWNFTSD